jgi:hypothetical protein
MTREAILRSFERNRWALRHDTRVSGDLQHCDRLRPEAPSTPRRIIGKAKQ